MKYIALDIGSTYLKMAILDLDQLSIEVIPEISMPKAFTDDDHLCHEINVEMIYEVVRSGIDSCIHREQEKIGGILISTQMHGFVFCDEDGKAKTPYISWQDNRCLRRMSNGRTYLEYLKEHITKEEMLTHGLYLKPGLGFCNAWTAIQQKTFPIETGDYLCALGAYIIYKLTGQKKCHITNAAPIGLVDVRNRVWDRKLIEKIGFEKYQMFKMVDDTENCGMYESEYGSIPVYPDYGDQQMAVLGSMMKEIADVNLNVATAAQLAYISDKFTNGSYETRPYFEKHYLNTMTRLPSGRGLDVLIRFIEDIGKNIYEIESSKGEIWSKVSEAVVKNSKEPLNCDVGFFPDLLGTQDGYIGGIDSDNLTVGNLFDSVIKKYADIYADYLNRLVPDCSMLKRIVYTGGAIQKNLQLQLAVEEKTGLIGMRSGIECEVFLGHLRMALLCSGRCKTLADTMDVIMANDKLNYTIRERGLIS